MTQQNIEAELSYAYLHAVASFASIECSYTGRLEDANGVDARLIARKDVLPQNTLCPIEATLNVQIKATINKQSETEDKITYFLQNIQQYNKLRETGISTPRILIVYFLPKGDPSEWLNFSEEQLILHGGAYWISLKGAPDPQTSSGVTLEIPKANIFSPEALKSIMVKVSNLEPPKYGEYL